MGLGATVRWVIAFGILVILNYTLRPLLATTHVEVDFLIVALLLAAVRVRPGAAALFGFVMGLAADATLPSSFGSAALAMTLVGFAASWLKAVFFADNLFLNAFFLFLGKWVFDLVSHIAERRLRGVEWIMETAVWSPLSAALTAVAGVLLLILLRPLLETTTA